MYAMNTWFMKRVGGSVGRGMSACKGAWRLEDSPDVSIIYRLDKQPFKHGLEEWRDLEGKNALRRDQRDLNVKV